MINLGKPFAKISGATIIGCQKPYNRTVDQRFVQKRVDIGLTDFQIAKRVQKKVPVTRSAPVLCHERGCRRHDLHQTSGAGAALGAG